VGGVEGLLGPKGILAGVGDAFGYAAKQGNIEIEGAPQIAAKWGSGQIRMTTKAAAEAAETKRLIEEGLSNGVLTGNRMRDILGQEAARPWEQVPGGGLGWMIGGTPQEGEGALAKAGRMAPFPMGMRAGQMENFTQRAGYYLSLRRNGYSPGQAMNYVKQALYDYGDLSKFDRDVMTRMVPFWIFFKKNLPFQLAKIGAEPGGVTAQTVRAVSEAGQGGTDTYKPQFLAEGNSLPIGGTPEARNFFNPSMIPLSEFNDVVFQNGNPINRRSLEKPMGDRLHPLVNLLPELLANRQFSTGRGLDTLESPSGAITNALTGTEHTNYWVDRALHYSPVSRAVGEAWAVGDPRKAWYQRLAGLLGAGRTSTYDTQKYQLSDVRNAYGQHLEEEPDVRSWINHSLPQDTKAKIGPEKTADIEAAMRREEQITKMIKQYKRQQEGAQVE
jgi:hypothetical protein